jgi:PAS domain S-box-containing protein
LFSAGSFGNVYSYNGSEGDSGQLDFQKDKHVHITVNWQETCCTMGGIAALLGILSLLYLLTARCARRAERRKHTLAALLDTLPDLALILDERGQSIEVLSARAAPEGSRSAPRKWELMSHVFPNGQFEKVLASVRLALESGTVQTFRSCRPSPKGDSWFETRITPLGRTSGKKRSALVLVRDITPAKHAEDALLANEEDLIKTKERFRVMVEKATDCFMIIDRDMRITYISPSVLNVTGRSPEELTGLRFDTNVHPDDKPKAENQYRRALAKTEANLPSTLRIKHLDGSWHLIEAVMNNMEDNPAVRGVVVNFRDVTEQRLLERQFQQVQKMETMGHLAGGVAHDFNNCLQCIQGLVELLIPNAPAGSPQAEDLLTIKRISQQAASVTRQLLVFSQRQVFEARILNLNTVVHDQQKILARIIGENIVLEFRPEPLLWPIRADVGLLQQVIMNLVVNARDAMPAGGHILIATSNTAYAEHDILPGYDMRAGRFVRLSVSDRGAGMTPDVVTHIFEPFFTTKERGKGTGLGLSVVHGIVKQHDGWIHVYSTPGNGSEFKVYLPVCSPAESGSPDAAEAGPPRGRGERILLVEDDPAALIVTSRNLVQQGYAVRSTTTCAEARALFRRSGGAFDMLLGDVVLPDGSGVDLTCELLTLKPALKIILTSGYADDKARWHEITEQGWAFLQKPYPFDELFRLMNRCFSDTQPPFRGPGPA